MLLYKRNNDSIFVTACECMAYKLLLQAAC